MAEYEEELTDALKLIARALRELGTNNAATEMGAIEMLALEVREGSTRIAEGLQAIAEAISERE